MNKRYDFDILFSSNNVNFINGRYPNQRVVTYTAKKPKKKLFTEDDLFTTDTFSFGTRIGQITNCASTFVSMLPLYPERSKEYETIFNRIKACCAAQSRQIKRKSVCLSGDR